MLKQYSLFDIVIVDDLSLFWRYANLFNLKIVSIVS